MLDSGKLVSDFVNAVIKMMNNRVKQQALFKDLVNCLLDRGVPYNNLSDRLGLPDVYEGSISLSDFFVQKADVIKQILGEQHTPKKLSIADVRLDFAQGDDGVFDLFKPILDQGRYIKVRAD